MKTIWHHCCHNPDDPLDAILTGKFFSHVLLSVIGPDDMPHPALWTGLASRVRAAGKTPILCRWLWPAYSVGDYTELSINVFDWRWYARRLIWLRQAAEQCGAETSLDTEPYGVNTFVQGLRDNDMCDRYYDMRTAAEHAARVVGPAKYILPAHMPYPRHATFSAHLYRAVEPLGEYAIAEHTYYDYGGVTGVADERFAIAGVAVVTDPAGRKEPFDHCYTPESLFKSPLCKSSGIMVYPVGDAKDQLATARAIANLAL